MKLSEMKQALAAGNIQLTKSLGQNFLHDSHHLERIVETAELRPTDKVLEVGPGLGPLTDLLLQRAGKVLAIEKDQRLFDVLQKRFREQIRAGKLELLHADALDHVRSGHLDWSDWKVVANLPYSVASPILVELALAAHRPERFVVTLQLEVARRLMAAPGDADYGLLTVLTRLFYQPQGSFKIPATCFFPPPDVDSACVHLLRRDPPILPQAAAPLYTRVVKTAFSQRRKMMFKLLKASWPEPLLLDAFRTIPLDRSIRAEQVSVEQFVRLTQCLDSKSKP